MQLVPLPELRAYLEMELQLLMFSGWFRLCVFRGAVLCLHTILAVMCI